MLRLKCIECGKALPADSSSRRCSLCAMGFAPGRQVDLRASYQTGLQIAGGDDSGINCTRCHARLSMLDATRQKCPHCHAAITQQPVQARSELTPHWRRSAPAKQPVAPARVWPDKAPIR